MMKKLTDTNIVLFVLLSVCASLSSCNTDNKDYPSDYVGFKHSTWSVMCSKNEKDSDLEITIIATEKSDNDRTVLITVPPQLNGKPQILTLTENKVTIKEGKKSAKTIIKIHPSNMILKQQSIILSCTPQWKEGKVSTFAILFKQKDEEQK